MYEYFRGNPHGRNPLEMLRDREPLPAHYMDRDARVAVIERQGLEASVAVPDAGRPLRGAAQARHRSGDDARARVQPLARGRLGLQLQGQDLRGALPLAGRSRLRDPRARLGARAGRARGRDAARADLDRAGPALARRPDLRPVLGARRRGRHHGRRPRGRLGLHHARLHARRLRVELRQRQQLQAVGEVVPDRARRLRLPDHAQSTRSCSSATRTCASRRWRTARSSCRICSASSSSRRTACPATTRRIHRRCSAPTSGSTRSGKTT